MNSNESSIQKIPFNLEEKPSVLETPQVNVFKHENVFAVAFKDALLRTNSIQLMNENLDIIGEPIIQPNLSQSIIPESSGIKSAPKKSILYRTISQTDIENQKQENQKTNEILTENKNLNCNNLNCNENLKQIPLVLFENDKPKMVENKFETKTNGNFINQNIVNMNLKRENSNLISPGIILDFKRLKTDNFKALYENSLKESFEKTDSFLSSSTSSSIDEVVTSSDQLENDKKAKKKRSIEMNTEERKNQIRSSNREAARRCRERKRKYIDLLENKIRELESRINELTKENNELKKMSYTQNTIQSNQIPVILNVPNQTTNQLLLSLQEKNFQDNQKLQQQVYQMLVASKREAAINEIK